MNVIDQRATVVAISGSNGSGDDMSIQAAIAAFTTCIREHNGSTAFSIMSRMAPPEMSPEDAAAWRNEVEDVCAAMDALAISDRASLHEFERLRRKMGTNFPSTPPELLRAVADAFVAANRH